MRTRISNGLLTVSVKHKGAELESLFSHATNIDYMWGADAAFWGKSSPVLFPIVGALKDGSFTYEGKSFHLSRHGFARDREFLLEVQEPHRLVFLLKSDEASLKFYPFSFEFRIIYTLDQFALSVSYDVGNLTDGPMFFSVGAHPAFKVPLTNLTSYEDYFLKFGKKETKERWSVTSEGLIDKISYPFLNDEDVLPLTRELFYNDALVFKGLESNTISIRSHKHTNGIDFSFTGFPFFGIWAAPDADFVCLEPWCGIADSVTHNGLLEEKEGMVQLTPGATWQRGWEVKCY